MSRRAPEEEDEFWRSLDPRAREPAPRPGLREVREWIDVPAVELSDGQLRDIYNAEVTLQEEFCRTVPYDWGLRLALMRRCARTAAARGLPLGTLPVQMTGYPDAYGAMLIPRLDAEVERYEAPRRVIAVA